MITCRLPLIRKRVGRCYELAYKGQAKASEWILVHGYVNGELGRIDHAWLECENQIYDAVKDEVYSVEIYTKKFNAVAVLRYDPKSAALNVVESGHSGPWDYRFCLTLSGKSVGKNVRNTKAP